MKESTYHHGDLKRQLMETGLKIVKEKGVEGLSLRMLARECQVSEAAPYSHFKNKEELLMNMQTFVTGQLQDCLEEAYERSVKEENGAKPVAALKMGMAYVLFFMQYPEYYSFLFSQAGLHINLCFEEEKTEIQEFYPFNYFKEKVYAIYRSEGMDDKKIKFGMIGMWAKVHGLAAIASMKGIIKDFEWEEVLTRVLSD